jgi:uncharacterized protein (DUF2147 family)
MCTPISRTLGSNVGAALSIGIMLLAAMSTTASAADSHGVWLTEDKDAVLTITNCGGQFAAGSFGWRAPPIGADCVGLTKTIPILPSGTADLRTRCYKKPQPSGPNTWDGYVYNPQDGKPYSGNITALSDKALRLRAYIGLPIFGKSQPWTRVDRSAGNGIEYHCRSPG